MLKWTKWKAHVPAVLVTLLCVYLIQPVLDRTPAFVLGVVSTISQRWEDAIYQDAAQPVSIEGLVLLMLVILGFALVVILKPFDERFSRRAIVPFILLLALIVTGASLLRNTSATIERCFRTRVAILSPHITDREAKELGAAWAMMRSHAEYTAINAALGEFARKHNVVAVLKSLEGPPRGTCL